MSEKFLKWLLHFQLFRRKEHINGRWSIITWWEVRRIPYNLIVGASGLLAGMIAILFEILTEHVTHDSGAWPDPPLFIVFFIAAYAIIANICYTLGWVAELLARHTWRERADHIGEISFVLGTVFSAMLTLMPGCAVAMIDIIIILKHIHAH